MKHKANRLANIIAGVTKFFVIGSGSTNASYMFFATIEVACMITIILCAWKLTED